MLRWAAIITGGAMSSDLLGSDLLHAVERAAVRGWPALETDAANGWLWRYTSGGSVRANTVATLAYHWTEVETAIEYCERLYTERGAPTVFAISDVTVPLNLDAALADRGYARGGDHITMLKPVDPDITLPAGVAVGIEPTHGWMAAYLTGLSPDRRAIAPRLIAGLPRGAVFLADQTDGAATSSGLTVIDGALASVQCMATRPETQRRGGAQRVLQGIEALAAQNGAAHLYLQTDLDNRAAQALYTRYGFSIIGRYHTRTKTLGPA
jgi:N-acetylglutamate synthase